MKGTSDFNKLVLEGCVEEIEKLHSEYLDLKNDYTKQLVESMVKFILIPFDYENDVSRLFKNNKSKFFKSGMLLKKLMELLNIF